MILVTRQKKLADSVTGKGTAIGVAVRQAERQDWSKDSCEQVLVSAIGVRWMHGCFLVKMPELVSREDSNQPISNTRPHASICPDSGGLGVLRFGRRKLEGSGARRGLPGASAGH